MDKDSPTILLVPIGDVAGLLHHVAKRLSAAFDLPCRPGDQIGPPTVAYDRSRSQYRGQDILFIALPRLRPSFYGKPKDSGLLRQRVVKEAVHELGHTYGLDHCSNPNCVMYFSNRLQDTDAKSTAFCQSCEAELAQVGHGR